MCSSDLQDMPFAISACNCIISSNTEPGWEYAGALRIIEAMACGTPVICQRSPAREEMLGKDYPLFMDRGKINDYCVDNIFEFVDIIVSIRENKNQDLIRDSLIERAKFYSIEENSKRIKETLTKVI